MTSTIRSIGIAAGLLFAAGIQNAGAQISEVVEFTTTFPFMAGNAMVPAGTYTIRPDDDDPQILEMTGERTMVLIPTQSVSPRQTPTKTELVFKHSDGGYLLKDIWIEGSNEGAETMLAESERHMAKYSASERDHRVAGKKKAKTS
jgi:hypothetical protein